MFKFIEKKSCFYLCNVISIILTLLPVFLIPSSLNFATTIQIVIIAVLLLCMILFFSYEHKELMKALLTSFLTAIVFYNIGKAYSMLSNLPQLIGSGANFITVLTNILPFILLIILLCNHFAVNFNGKASKVTIKINQGLVIAFFIIIVVDKLFSYVITGKLFSAPSAMRVMMMLDGLQLVFYTLATVSAESFINVQRANK